MGETTMKDLRASFCWGDCEPFGSPSASSEVTGLRDFYRAECLTAFGAARCEPGQLDEAPQIELRAAA